MARRPSKTKPKKGAEADAPPPAPDDQPAESTTLVPSAMMAPATKGIQKIVKLVEKGAPPPVDVEAFQAEFGLLSAAMPAVTRFLSTGIPVLDYAISNRLVGGGIPEGRITEIYGVEGSGKSGLLNGIYASAGRAGGGVIDCDLEGTREPEQLFSLGLRPEQIIYPRLYPGGARQVFDFIRWGLRRLYGARFTTVLGLDTIATLRPEEEIAGALGEDKGKAWGIVSKLATEAMPQFASMVWPARVAMVIVNQLKLSQQNYQTVESTAAAKPVKFFAGVRIRMARIEYIKDVLGRTIGYLFVAHVVKNKCAPPQRKVALPCYFDTGFDPIGAVFLSLRENGLLGKSHFHFIQTRQHRRTIYLREEHRYDQWAAFCQEDPTLIGAAMRFLWDPWAPQILTAGENWQELAGNMPPVLTSDPLSALPAAA